MNDNDKGRAIVFEGIDKAGKTTQSQMLYEYIEKNFGNAILISFPDYTSNTGKEIRAYLDGHRENFAPEWLHIMYAANRYEWKNVIDEFLSKGKILIFNRYYESNIAYGVARGLDISWLLNLDKMMPKPHLTIILDIPVDKSKNRNSNPDKNESNLEYLENVRKTFLDLAEMNKWVILNANDTKENLHEEVLRITKDILS